MTSPAPALPPDSDDEPRRLPGAWRGDLLLFLGLLAAYILTAATTLQGHDNAEWISLSVLGGTAHPPGYPLYGLLLRTWGLLPVGEPVFRASLLSAVLMAAAALVLARGVEERSGSVFAARVVAVAFGLSLPTWRLAGVAEVSALLALNAAALVWLVAFIDNEPELFPWHGAVLGALLGVGVVHHHSVVMLVPLILHGVFISHAAAGFRRWSRAVGAGVLAGSAVVVGTWLVWLALPVAPDAYHFQTITGVPAWWDCVLRREYGTLSSSFMAGKWSWAPTADLLRDTAAGLHVLAFLAVLALLARRAWPVLLCWALAGPWLLGSFTVALGPDVLAPLETRERFHVLPLLLTAVLAHDALASLAYQLPRRRSVGYTRIMTALLLVVTAGAPLVALPEASWRGEDAVEHTLRTAVRSAPPGAVVVVDGDPWQMGWNLVSRWEGRQDLLAVDWPRSLLGRRQAAQVQQLLRCELPCTPPKTAIALTTLSRTRPVVLFPAVLAGALVPGEPVAVEGMFARITEERPPLEQQLAVLRAFQTHEGIPDPRRDPRRHFEAVALASWAAPWMVLTDVAQRAGQPSLAQAAHAQAREVLGRIGGPAIDGSAQAP